MKPSWVISIGVVVSFYTGLLVGRNWMYAVICMGICSIVLTAGDHQNEHAVLDGILMSVITYVFIRLIF